MRRKTKETDDFITFMRLGGCTVGRLYGWAVLRLGGFTVVRLGGWAVVRLGGFTVSRIIDSSKRRFFEP